MRIAILHYSLKNTGGSQKVAHNLAVELSADYEISLLSMNSPINESFLSDEYDCCSFENVLIINRIINLNRYLNEKNVEVLLLIGTGCGFYLPFISRSIRVIVSEQSNVLNKVYMNSFKTRLNHSFSAKLASHIVCLTSQDKEAWVSRYNLKEEKVSVIHNYIVPKEMKGLNRVNKIITIGSFDPVKGYEYLVEVARKVLNQCDWTWHVYAMGDNDYKQQIINSASDLERKLVFEQPQSDLTDIYQSAKINVMTSRNEGLPLSLIEAKAYGCVNVAFDCVTGPADVIRNEIDGYLIDCFSVNEMTDKIMNIINNDEIRQEMSSNSLKDLNRFSKDEVIKSWKHLIDNELKAFR